MRFSVLPLTKDLLKLTVAPCESKRTRWNLIVHPAMPEEKRGAVIGSASRYLPRA